jgi:hypothetical protein
LSCRNPGTAGNSAGETAWTLLPCARDTVRAARVEGVSVKIKRLAAAAARGVCSPYS